MSDDPFAHHPELRGKIANPEASFFRDFTFEGMIERFPEMAVHRDWPHKDEDREAMRAAVLNGHGDDLWVFGYGSLMWDPALYFAEVRRAYLPGYERKMMLVDWRGARGTAEAPGLMAALDAGHGCDGLAFRIAADAVDTETRILFRREMLAPAYLARMVPIELDDGPVQALTFVADHAVPEMRADIGREEQIRYIAHGAGFAGTSRDYLANIVAHFETLGIEDADCEALLRDVDGYLAAKAQSA